MNRSRARSRDSHVGRQNNTSSSNVQNNSLSTQWDDICNSLKPIIENRANMYTEIIVNENQWQLVRKINARAFAYLVYDSNLGSAYFKKDDDFLPVFQNNINGLKIVALSLLKFYSTTDAEKEKYNITDLSRVGDQFNALISEKDFNIYRERPNDVFDRIERYALLRQLAVACANSIKIRPVPNIITSEQTSPVWRVLADVGVAGCGAVVRTSFLVGMLKGQLKEPYITITNIATMLNRFGIKYTGEYGILLYEFVFVLLVLFVLTPIVDKRRIEYISKTPLELGLKYFFVYFYSIYPSVVLPDNWIQIGVNIFLGLMAALITSSITPNVQFLKKNACTWIFLFMLTKYVTSASADTIVDDSYIILRNVLYGNDGVDIVCSFFDSTDIKNFITSNFTSLQQEMQICLGPVYEYSGVNVVRDFGLYPIDTFQKVDDSLINQYNNSLRWNNELQFYRNFVNIPGDITRMEFVSLLCEQVLQSSKPDEETLVYCNRFMGYDPFSSHINGWQKDMTVIGGGLFLAYLEILKLIAPEEYYYVPKMVVSNIITSETTLVEKGTSIEDVQMAGEIINRVLSIIPPVNRVRFNPLKPTEDDIEMLSDLQVENVENGKNFVFGSSNIIEILSELNNRKKTTYTPGIDRRGQVKKILNNLPLAVTVKPTNPFFKILHNYSYINRAFQRNAFFKLDCGTQSKFLDLYIVTTTKYIKDEFKTNKTGLVEKCNEFNDFLDKMYNVPVKPVSLQLKDLSSLTGEYIDKQFDVVKTQMGVAVGNIWKSRMLSSAVGLTIGAVSLSTGASVATAIGLVSSSFSGTMWISPMIFPAVTNDIETKALHMSEILSKLDYPEHAVATFGIGIVALLGSMVAFRKSLYNDYIANPLAVSTSEASLNLQYRMVALAAELGISWGNLDVLVASIIENNISLLNPAVLLVIQTMKIYIMLDFTRCYCVALTYHTRDVIDWINGRRFRLGNQNVGNQIVGNGQGFPGAAARVQFHGLVNMLIN
jgi:hypothetical protein